MYKQPKKALNCLIDTYEEVHATNRGNNYFKSGEKKLVPPYPPK